MSDNGMVRLEVRLAEPENPPIPLEVLVSGHSVGDSPVDCTTLRPGYYSSAHSR